ncbi:hypothetical protein C8J56DRAFT_1054140 [Mycena floridula]|nr:hypothetical protein C8J56DRAFT_1054140 [Mycena floridula]
MLGDYFKENPEAAELTAEVAELLGWLLNHQRVRTIFDASQCGVMNREKALAYLVPNLTRWTTHLIAFHQLLTMKSALRAAVNLHRLEIIAAQVGAAKSGTKPALELEAAAEKQCEVIDDSNFWKHLQSTAEDIEPICFGTNINQSDDTHPDQFLLSLAGIFLYFSRHSNAALSRGMKKRIERRWKDIGHDQELYVVALILNPFEGISRFGDKAGINVWSMEELISKAR